MDQSGAKQAKGKAAANPVTGVGQRSVDFVQEAWQELKKVHWPTRQETQSATVVVVAVVIVMSIFLGVVDFALSYAMQFVIS